MKTKKFMALFYGNKNQLLYQFIMECTTMIEINAYISSHISKNPANEWWLLETKSQRIKEVNPNETDAEEPLVNETFIINADNAGLTPREKQVVLEMRDGKSLKDGANRLCISENTLKNHIGAINQKVGGRSLKASTALLYIPKQKD